MKPTKIIIHCSASTDGKRVDIDEIAKWHKARGFKSVGYHMVVQPDGEVQNGRGLNEQGAHCEGENDDSIGICLVGLDKFTEKQFHVLRYKLDSIFLTYDIKKKDLYCHYQFDKHGKTCPNITINDLIEWYRFQDESVLEPYLLEAEL